MASIIPYKGKKWRAFICVDNVHRSKVCRTRREAEAWAAAETSRIEEEAEMPPEVRITLREGLENYLRDVSPKKRSKFELYAIPKMISHPAFPGNESIGQIKPILIARYRDARAMEVGPSSVNREVAVISAFFSYCIKVLYILDANPCSAVPCLKIPKHRDKTYSWKQIKKICKFLSYQTKAPVKTLPDARAHAFLFALRTGMRCGEIAGLTWDRVHKDFVRLLVTKTGPRDVPLEPQATQILERMRGYHPVFVFGKVIPTVLGGYIIDAASRAGVTGYTFHDARHTAATRISGKTDVLTLCKIFGWSNVKQAMTYYNPRVVDIAKALRKKPA